MKDNEENTIYDRVDETEETIYDRPSENSNPTKSDANANVDEASQNVEARMNKAQEEEESEQTQLDFESEPSASMKTSFWSKIKNRIITTYVKRNPIANALLTVGWLAAVIPACMILVISVAMVGEAFFGLRTKWPFFILSIVFSYYGGFYIYYAAKFIIGNQKKAILPFLLGATVICYFIFLGLAFFYTPDSELDEPGHIYLLFLFEWVPAIILVAISFGIIYLIMRIRKDGVSAWRRLEVIKGKRSRFDKTSIIIFSLLWLVPVGLGLYEQYRLDHPKEPYPSHKTAKIGDYYYQDGTVSSELLPDKTPVGIVFSLEPPVYDMERGYTHGQIVSLSDISEEKMTWDSDTIDYERYPNYTWDNRLNALEDLNGYYYVIYQDNFVLSMNWKAAKYQEYENGGLSEWYVPTAGQWALILKNLGQTEVDRMLKFDSETASNNLRKINIDPNKWYWTITEFDKDYAWSIRLANGEFGSRSHKLNTAYVRPVASF